MVGIEAGTDLARGDKPTLFVGVVEPEIEGGAEGLLEPGKGCSFQPEVDDSRTSSSPINILDLFNSLSTVSSLSIPGGEADLFFPLVTPLEDPASDESVATTASAFRTRYRACLRGDWSRETL